MDAQTLRLPPIMGHRGAAASAPENTLSSLRRAAELGASWVEFDVMLTRDDVPILFHDDSLKRITGKDALMADTDLCDLNGLDAGAWFDEAFRGERIPTLEAAIQLVHQLGMRVNIEIKSTLGRDVVTARRIVETLSAIWPADQPPPLLSSFSRMSLAAVQVLQPEWPRALLVFRIPKDWQTAVQALECTAFHVFGRRLNQKIVSEVKQAGYQLAAFTVNKRPRARTLAAFGVDCLITDAPDEISAALSRPQKTKR